MSNTGITASDFARIVCRSVEYDRTAAIWRLLPVTSGCFQVSEIEFQLLGGESEDVTGKFRHQTDREQGRIEVGIRLYAVCGHWHTQWPQYNQIAAVQTPLGRRPLLSQFLTLPGS